MSSLSRLSRARNELRRVQHAGFVQSAVEEEHFRLLAELEEAVEMKLQSAFHRKPQFRPRDVEGRVLAEAGRLHLYETVLS